MKQKLLFTGLMVFMLLISVRGWGQYTGTGTFTKITSVDALTDGYYVILNETDGFVMTNGRSGNATTGYFISAAISPSSGTITDPSSSNVWKIEASGTGKTIYNESIAKYVGWSSGNSASIEDEPANTSRWTFTYESSKFTVNNVAEPARQLSYNSGAPRFAAYGNNGQQELQLYKMGASPTIPTISLTPTSLSGFTYIIDNGPSSEQTFTVSGTNLTADISIAATTNYEISKTSGSDYATPLAFTQTDGTVEETTVYVRLKAGLSVGTYNGEEITATSTDASNKTVSCSGTVTEPAVLPYSEDFSDCGTQEWISVSVASNRDWTCGSGYQEINGFGGDVASNDYLISPIFNLDSYTNEVLSFESFNNYSDASYPPIEILYTTNYTGDPSTTIWQNDLIATWSPENSSEWTTSGSIDVSGIAGTTIQFAFHYTSTGTGGGSTSLWRIDNILLQEVDVADPNSFAASAQSISQINLTFETNAADDEVVIVYNTDGSFTDPSGAAPAVGQAFAGGTVLYKGTSSPQAHTSLTPSETVYYKAWSVDGSNNYSPGLSDNATTLSNEPTNHATAFSASANSQSAITVSWTDSDASAYLVKASADSYGDITSPIDGVAEVDDVLVKNVAAASPNSVEFTGLTASTTYYFRIFPYNGTGETVNYKTDGTVPEDNATTDVFSSPTVLITRNCDPADNYAPDRFAEIYNAGAAAVDLTNWTLENIQGGSVSFTWMLSGSIAPGQTLICGNADATGQTISPDFTATWSGISWNGKGGDGTILKDDNGNIIDNAVQSDVTGTFENGQMKRKLSVTIPTVTYDESEWVFSSVSNALDIVPGFHGTVWRGTGTVWTTESNWDNLVPNSSVNSTIPGNLTNYPSIDNSTASPANTNNLNIASGAVLTIPADKVLTVTGTLTNNAGNNGLIIESNSGGTGSLLHNTDNVPATVKRYISGNSTILDTYDYHTVSVPLNSTGTANLFNGSYLYQFNLTTQALESMGDATDTPLPNNQGYMIFYPDDNITYDFAGQINNGDFPIPTAQGIDEFTLAPNPYPSAIDWDAASGWTKTNLYDAFWIWNPAADNYAAYGTDVSILNATQYIPVGQAFFVKANAAASALTVMNDARVHNDQVFFKNQKNAANNLLRVKTATEESADETIVRFLEGASSGADEYDIDKIIGGSAAPQIYSLINSDRKTTVNTLSYSAESLIVPMAYELSNDETALLSFEGVDSFDPTVEIFLEDLLANKMIDLREQNTYTFEHAAENDPLRFKIHFMGVTNVNELASTPVNFTIWASEEQLYIHTNTAFDGDLQIELFDLSGRLLKTIKQPTHSPNSIMLPDYEGVIMVRVRNNSAVQTQKVFIR